MLEPRDRGKERSILVCVTRGSDGNILGSASFDASVDIGGRLLDLVQGEELIVCGVANHHFMFYDVHRCI